MGVLATIVAFIGIPVGIFLAGVILLCVVCLIASAMKKGV